MLQHKRWRSTIRLRESSHSRRVLTESRSFVQAATKLRESLGDPARRLERNNTLEVLPMVKLTIPFFVRGPQVRTRKDLVDEERMERVGTLDPDCISKMLRNKKLLNELREAAEMRKQAEQQRLRVARDPEALVADADQLVDKRLTEEEHLLIRHGGSHDRPKSHLYLTSVTKLVGACKQARRKISQNEWATTASAKKDADSLAATKEKERTRRLLEQLTKNSASAIKELKRGATGIWGRSGLGSPSQCAHASGSETKPHAPRGGQEKYAVDSYDQFCAVADSLCDSFKSGNGRRETERYLSRMREAGSQRRIQSYRSIMRQQLRDSTAQLSAVSGRVETLNRNLEARVSALYKWLDS